MPSPPAEPCKAFGSTVDCPCFLTCRKMSANLDIDGLLAQYADLNDDDEIEIEGVSDEKDLIDMIDSTLKDLGFGSESATAAETISGLQTKLETAEREEREVARLFKDCEDIIAKYDQGQKASSEIPETIICESDSDDDLQVIEVQPSQNTQTAQQRLEDALRNALTKPVNGGTGTTGTPPSQRHGRSPPTPNGSNYKPILPKMSSILPQQHTEMYTLLTKPMPPQAKPAVAHKPVDLACGMKLYAKKFTEKWYKGTLTDIMGADGPKSQRKYKVKFDGKGMKVVSGKALAYHDHPTDILPVGSRVIAMYRDDEDSTISASSFYAGIIAEPPSVRNNNRYLTFFDDGYAQYCTSKDLHRVCEQSKNVWEDIHPDSQDFIKGYLQQYPERPMVRLQRNQVVKTEWNGEWWVAHVKEVDASLVKMYFEADKRVEWIYRGSTRLEPLYTELRNAEASKLAGKGRRHHTNMKTSRKPVVEYLGGDGNAEEAKRQQLARQKVSEDSTVSWPGGSPAAAATTERPAPSDVDLQAKKRSVAKKSTARKSSTQGSKPDTPDVQSGTAFSGHSERRSSNKGSGSMAVKDRIPEIIDLDSEESQGEHIEITNCLPVRERKRFVTHLCGNHCIRELEQDIQKLKGSNPLLFPQMCGWERQITKQKNTYKRLVFYRAPCGRRTRDLEETDYFLLMTKSVLTIDYFCFDPNLRTNFEYSPDKTFCDIKDLSYGKENVAVSCVNGVDRQYPDYVEYSNRRLPAKGVKLNLDAEFLSGCDCTDGCRDPSKCACIQMTVAATKVIPGLNPDLARYEHRRLREPLISGIFECNSRCRCDSRCLNRVAQHPLLLRLQVFKTEKRGWGLRCLDDIPAGGFICVYAGQLLTEQGANEDGQVFGDEYLAELDYIEVVERTKEGYESDVNEGDGAESEKADTEDEYKDQASDSTYSGERRYNKKLPKSVKSVKDSFESREVSGKQKAQDWLDSLPTDDVAIVISDEEDSNGKKPSNLRRSDSRSSGVASKGADNEDKIEGGIGSLKITDPTSLNTDNIELDDSEEDEKKAEKTTAEGEGLRRSTRNSANRSRFRNLPDPKSQKPISPLKINLSSMQITKKQDKQLQNQAKKEQIDTRRLFGEEFCYVMDAKSVGNLGRYLNHSCTPNVFVQNVFVDTHDLRFPWVAFFAYQFIRAGEELTWDYNYEVGSVPGKVLYCYCGSSECRGRLL